MWFFYLEFFLVAILPLEAKTCNCLTFHNLYQEGCLCQTITSKQIKLKIPAWSGFDGLEKFFLTVMWFFYLKFFLAEIWLTLATWSKSTITHHHHQIFKKEIDFFSKFCLANNWPWGITCSHKSIQQLPTSPRSGQSSLRLSVYKDTVLQFTSRGASMKFNC